ncbi:MAG: protoporphyrinogen oxidase, partial [Chloroflexi bacterium]|nr:protoporphyrinogen oxidase [Chloroflexota bacterium]
IPQNEDSNALACTWTSSKWRHRAPDGFALLRVFIGRIQDSDILPQEESALISIARAELRKTMNIIVDPTECWVFRWEKAMPQYNLGHPERLERIDAELAAFPSLALAGNGYRGIGMPDCIRSGIQAADKLFSFSQEE